jgi:hypothetical protein
MWQAHDASEFAMRLFGKIVEPVAEGATGSCPWCGAGVADRAPGDEAGCYCGIDCARAARIAGLYLG